MHHLACPEREGTEDQGQKTSTSEKHLRETVVARKAPDTFCRHAKTTSDMLTSAASAPGVEILRRQTCLST